MIRSLRRRLILSHILPLLVILPLVGLALVYLLDTQVILPYLADEVVNEAELVADLAGGEPVLWIDPSLAQAFVASVTQHLTERVMLIDGSGILLASSDPANARQLGAALQAQGVSDALNGQTGVYRVYSMSLNTNIVDVMVPVRSGDGRILGVVRLSHSLGNVYDRFARQRVLIAVVIVVGLLLGGCVGWLLALDIERPLHRVTRAVASLASGQQAQSVAEEGPEDIRTLARSYNSLVERLTILEQTHSRLLANLVHELGRPLGALHSAIQALQGGADEQPELRRELLAGMDGEIGRLRRLLDDLAQLRDEIVGALELCPAPVNVSEWLAQILVPWREAAQQRGLHWQVNLPSELPTIQADPDRLAQAVGNLLSNAVKYTPVGGEVTIAAGQENDTLWIRVSDSGPGISADEQERILQPFYRSAAGRRFPQGMGLGLSIARALVVAHGGRLELQSTPGLGSQFTIRIPLTQGTG